MFKSTPRLYRRRPRLGLEPLEGRLMLSTYTFHNLDTWTNNVFPATLAEDAAGNFFFTSTSKTDLHGSVYEIVKATGDVVNIADFNGTNGSLPYSGVVLDSAGNIYGTTEKGGSQNDGTLYEIPHGSNTINTLVTFTGPNGAFPDAPLTIDNSGNIFGTTSGVGLISNPTAWGTYFELPHGSSSLVTLAIFSNTSTVGGGPETPFISDSAGNLYGAGEFGGANSYGTIFELAHGSTNFTLIAPLTFFNSPSQNATLLLDNAGNLYGVANSGGTGYTGDLGSGNGYIYEVPAGANATVPLINFGDADGILFDQHLIENSAGDIFGSTKTSIFEIPHGTTTITQLVTFTGANGFSPGPLMLDDSGNIYGSTTDYVNGGGTLFELSLDNPATHLAFVGAPPSASASVALSPALMVQTLDGSNAISADNTSSVTLAIATGPSGGTLTGVTTVHAVAGVASFSNIALSKPGLYTLTATDGSLTSATSTSFTIFAVPTQLAVTQAPTAGVAGVATSAFVVHVEDAQNNTVTSDTSTVSVTILSGPTGGTLAGTPSIPAAAGVATFSNLSFTKSGSYTLHFTDGSLTSADSGSFTISATTAAKLVIVQQPGSAVAGVAFSPVLMADVEDTFGNLVTTDGSSVTASIATGPNGAALAGITTVSAAAGVATFTGLSLAKAGTYTLTVSDTGLTADTSTPLNITPAAAAQLAFIQGPNPATAGVAIAPALTVAVEDAFGNIVTGNTSSIAAAIATGPAGGTLTGTASVHAVAGVATFSNLALPIAGAYTLKATDGGLTQATSSSFNITPAAASKLAFTQPPTDAVAGVAIAPAVVISVEDAFGNVVAGNTASVTLAIATGPAGGLLSGTTNVAAIASVASFADLSLAKAGPYTLTASAAGLTPATSGSFIISPAAPAQLVFGQPPLGALANTAIAPAVTVEVEDAFGNLVTIDASNVSLAIADGPAGGTLSGGSAVAASHGLATFSNLSLNLPGSYTLTASDGSLTPVTSDSFNIGAVTTAIAPGHKATFTDANGSLVTVVYAGKSGSAVVSRAVAGNLPGNILALDITGADSTAALTITSAGNTLTAIGSITSDAALNTITGKTVDLVGAGVDFSAGFANTITLHDLAASAAIDEPGSSAKGGKITLAHVAGGASIDVASGLTLQVADWSAGGSVTAPYLVSLKTTGDKTRALAGDFGADLNLSGLGVPAGKPALAAATIAGDITAGNWTVHGSTGKIAAHATDAPWQTAIDGAIASITTTANASGQILAGSLAAMKVGGNMESALITLTLPTNPALPTAVTLGTLTVTGSLDHSQILSAGNVKSVTVGAMIHSQLLIGVVPGVTALPVSAADFQPAGGTLAALTVKGLPGQTTAASFIDSIVNAWTITKATLKLVDTTSAGVPLGFGAGKIASLSFLASGVNAGKPITLQSLDTPADLLDPKKNPSSVLFPLVNLTLQLV